MSRTLLMEALRGETRLAVIEDGQLCELYVDRPGADDATGAIFLGRVENVVSGMNAAFVDIGMEKNGFLYAGDVGFGDRELQTRLDELRIEKLARPGQEMLMQVMKAQSGQKGHRLSCHIALPGRTLVLLPQVSYVGVSRKITGEGERSRLKGIAAGLTETSGMGLIVRTAAEGLPPEALSREYEALTGQWRDIEVRAAHAIAPRRVFSNRDLALRCVRDMLGEDVEAVWADGQALFDALRTCAESLAPQWLDRIRLHDSPTPLFDLYRVDAQLEKALRKYVWLKSGGSLVIEETEAMTVIDVNTGKFTGKKNLDDTLYRLNCEAAAEIVRQLRLRDIGGIVVVDFIDMRRGEDNERLLELLRTLVKVDRCRVNVVGMTGLGLVELTRKKERRSLSKQLLHICSACGGDGMVPTYETTARRIVREIWRRRRAGESHPMLVSAVEPVVKWLQTIGAPEGGPVYARKADVEPDSWDIAPADAANLPEGCRPIRTE